MKDRLLSPTSNTQICLWGNLLLSIFKLLAGILGNSQAMIADGFHSASDVAATFSTWLGVRLGRKPADLEHPYGHGNIETLVAVGIGGLIIFTAGYIGYEAFHILAHHHFQTPTILPVIGAAVSIIIKEGMYRYTIAVARGYNSPALEANAHDHRADALSSVGALFGILGAKAGWVFLDPLAGIGIALTLIWVSTRILRKNFRILMDGVADPRLLSEIKRALAQLPLVQPDGFKCRLHTVGPDHFLDLNLKVDPKLSVAAGHEIAEVVKESLKRKFPTLRDVVVHIEPYGTDSAAQISPT